MVHHNFDRIMFTGVRPESLPWKATPYSQYASKKIYNSSVSFRVTLCSISIPFLFFYTCIYSLSQGVSCFKKCFLYKPDQCMHAPTAYSSTHLYFVLPYS